MGYQLMESVAISLAHVLMEFLILLILLSTMLHEFSGIVSEKMDDQVQRVRSKTVSAERAHILQIFTNVIFQYHLESQSLHLHDTLATHLNGLVSAKHMVLMTAVPTHVLGNK